MHDHRGVIVLIHVTKWHWFPRVCNMYQHAWCFKGLWLITVWACRCASYTQIRNPTGAPQLTKCETLPDFRRENGLSLLPYSHIESLERI